MSETIYQLMEIIRDFCEEEGVSFYAKFKPKLEEKEEYVYTNGGFVFGASDVFNLVQHWEAKNNKKLFPTYTQDKKNGNTYNITFNTHGYDTKSTQLFLEKLINGIKEKGGNI